MLTCSASSALASENNHKEGLLVQYRDDIVAMPEILKAKDLRQVYRRQILAPKTELVEITGDAGRQAMMEQLKKSGQVKYVEVNKHVFLHRAPDDTYYEQQWALPVIRAEAAWDEAGTATKPVIVAVVDSGVDSAHADLINRIDSRGYNFVDDNQDVSDQDGHGTAVSSVIAALTDNSLGIAGVCGGAPVKILPLKTVGPEGYSYVSDVIRAIDYAVEIGADVINLSMGSNIYSDIENEAVQRAISHGITVVASAGNEGYASYDYPASYPGVISVGAIDSGKRRAEFSNYNDQVDVVAPGVGIITCVPGDSYDCLTGTSFASPMVAGTAAMLKSLDETLDSEGISRIIQETSGDLGRPGRDDEYGYGLLDMGRAVLQVLPVRVEAIQMQPAQVKIGLGETLQLNVIFEPVNATNRNLTWKSENNNIAVVNDQGLVRAVGIGQTIITAVSEDGNHVAVCLVTVVEAASQKFVTWGLQENVALDRTWYIRFSRAVAASSINQGNIYITDEQGNLLPVNFILNPDRDPMVVGVVPEQNYTSGKRYTLWIRNVLDKSGQTLKYGVKMDFIARA